MAVVPRGSKWQVNRTVRGVRAPRLTFDTKQEAEAWEAEVVAAIMAGREIPVPKGRNVKLEKTHKEGTLGHVAKECFDRHWKGTRSAKTQELYIELLKDYFGADTPVASITKPMIEDWMHHCREQGNAGSTINRKLSTLSKILSYAEGRYITTRPRVQRYPESLPSIRWLEPEEEENLVRLFRQWGLDDHADALIVFVDTGLRMSELWRLTGRHVDLKQGRMRITHTKTGLDRVVPMTSRVQAILSRRVDTHGRGKLFPGMTNANYRRAWERAKPVLGVDEDERFTPYITRHTCASRLVQRGVDLMIVKTWLGHSSIQTTMRYASLAPGHLNAGVEALESYT